jgi:L-alanine-DL-glutamate epimerase-like enolase superfamily enzyme
MRIADVRAYPVSYPIAPQNRVALGIGTAVKRDAVLVKVTTDAGLVGWGEAHHGRAHTAVAKLVETTLKQLILNLETEDIPAVWEKMYRYQLASHGMGAGACLAISGIDMALWDIRGKTAGQPLYKILGGSRKPIPAYAGGVSLGYQDEKALIEEAAASVSKGYKAIKLRVGDSVERDIERMSAIRQTFGKELVILTDANIGYTLDQVRRVMPAMDELGIGWLEEPFPAPDFRSYREAARLGRTPLAAGENHYTRFEFDRLIEDGAVRILQPDLSKSGGITEGLRIAALAAAAKLPIHPHSSMTGLNHAATIHFLAAIGSGGYFEGDVSRANRFRDELVDNPGGIDAGGCVWPLEKPGLGLEVDERFIERHPPIEGPGYV